MTIPSLQTSYLVGGTALALKFGHRISLDLDLFHQEEIDKTILIKELVEKFGDNFNYVGSPESFGLFCFINNVKVDILKYPHKQIKDQETIEGIRFYHTDDIVAMKINAILGRGRKKDFWDLAELLNHYSVAEIIKLHKQKFPNQMLLISIPQVLTYFNDANESEDPVSLKGQTWESVKQTIRKAVNEYLK
ncbi:MAG: nucleotidyl transferase AbiEii/AbiGii toxin family protein [Bacteroidia bacterium]